MNKNTAQLGAILAPVDGTCLGLTFGWDRPARLYKPYLTLEAFGWMVCLGWLHNPEQFAGIKEAPPAYERQACARVMRRDYWFQDMVARQAVCKMHDPDADEPRPFTVDMMLEEAGITDGDEFEILITATDRRPHGDRRYLLDKSQGLYRQETDAECLERITRDGHEDKSGQVRLLREARARRAVLPVQGQGPLGAVPDRHLEAGEAGQIL